jgi:transcriptional regulator with XRE-family HTH domain
MKQVTTVISVHGPTAGRRKLRTALRAARESAEMTQEAVAAAMDWSLSKLIRIETGRVSVSTNDVKALLELYGILDGEEREQFVDLARLARKKPWWQDFRYAVPDDYAQFIGLEAEAASLRCFQPTVVPGLLQTEDYARAILTGRAPNLMTDDDVRARAAVRLRRQEEVLNSDSPPRISVILDEAVLRRVPGNVSVLHEQLLQLVTIGSLPHVDIQVLPLAVGAFSSGGHFIIVTFPDPSDSHVVYLETVLAQQFIDRPAETELYEAEYERLRAGALSPADSLPFIAKIASEL